MNKLENIVPTLELCKQIPEGCFAESALVYEKMIPAFVCRSDGSDPTMNRGTGTWTISPRRSKISAESRRNLGGEFVPAPTLAEILAELPEGVQVRMRTAKSGKRHFQVYHYSYEAWTNSPAAAALQLWLRVREKAER